MWFLYRSEEKNTTNIVTLNYGMAYILKMNAVLYLCF